MMPWVDVVHLKWFRAFIVDLQVDPDIVFDLSKLPRRFFKL
jgi:hypothetical protein